MNDPKPSCSEMATISGNDVTLCAGTKATNLTWAFGHAVVVGQQGARLEDRHVAMTALALEEITEESIMKKNWPRLNYLKQARLRPDVGSEPIALARGPSLPRTSRNVHCRKAVLQCHRAR